MVGNSNAFLNGILETPVYMLQPEGFQSGGPRAVCMLKKTLYGLKQAPKEWNVLKTGLEEMGFEQSTTDQALWIRKAAKAMPATYTLH